MERFPYICFYVAVIRFSAAKICTPENNEYYHTQAEMCVKCDSCLVGAGKDTINGKDEINWDSKHGALDCVPCRPCPAGYFNDRRNFTCKPCQNCSKQDRYELKQCTSKSNAECGSLIEVHTVVTLTKVTVTEIDSSTQGLMLESPNLLTLYILGITLGVCTVLLLSVVLFICWRKLNAKQEETAMNNCIEAHELLHKGTSIVVIENANNETVDAKISKGTINNYNKTYVIDSLSSGGNSSRSSPERRCLIEGPTETETTPKVIALTTDNRESDNTIVPSTSNAKQTNLACNKCGKSGTRMCCNNLQYCARNTLCTMNNLSKSSLSSEGSEILLINTQSNGNIGNYNNNISLSDVEECLLKRSKFSNDNRSHELLTSKGPSSIQYCEV